MSITTVPTCSIRIIDEVSQTDAGARVGFRNGSPAVLEASQPHFEHLLWLAEWSRASRPIGVVTDAADHIIDLNCAHETGVAWVRHYPTNRNCFRVAFWAYSPICGLTRAHPDFDRILATLTAAAGTSQQLWVVTHSDETVDDEPDEGGLVARLPKIMDVRPTDAFSATNGALVAETE
jgi:hypothetical protein